MALLRSNMRTAKSNGITVTEISFWSREWEFQLKRTGWQKPNHVLTMFSGRLPMPMEWQVPIKVKPWQPGCLREKKEISKWAPVKFFHVVGDTNYLLFFSLFFSNLLFLFFFYQHFLSQHANIYHIVTSRLLLMILIETYGSFLLPFIWYQYVWYCSFLHYFLLLF